MREEGKAFESKGEGEGVTAFSREMIRSGIDGKCERITAVFTEEMSFLGGSDMQVQEAGEATHPCVHSCRSRMFSFFYSIPQ